MSALEQSIHKYAEEPTQSVLEIGFGIRYGKSQVKNLMWTNGSSRMQYRFFGDVVTIDTTYKTVRHAVWAFRRG